MKQRTLLLTGSLIVALLLAALLGTPVLGAPQAPVSTAFVYQGTLRNGSNLVNDICDFRFAMWDSSTGGAQIGTTNEKTEVAVADGQFTVELDFGHLLNQVVYLEVSARCPAGSGDYSQMASRQTLTPTPYALYVTASSWGGLTDVPAGFADGIDDDTTYSAGTGLFLIGTAFSLDEAFVGDIISSTLSAEPEWFTTLISNTVANSVDGQSEWFTTVLSETIANNPQWFEEIVVTNLISNTVIISGTFQSRIANTCPAGSSIRTVNADGTVVCETDSNTTYTAGSGLTLDGTTFNVYTSTIQTRVANTCPAGSSIRTVNADGTVVCETDSNTTYTAGDGLNLSGTTFNAIGSGYDNVVIVAKSGGDYTSIQSAIDSITDAGSSNRYLVWVAPGTYTEKVTMKVYVDIQGAGENLTFISSNGGSTAAGAGTVTGANYADLRDLTIMVTGSNTYGIGLYNTDTTSSWLEHVTISVSGGTNRYGVYNANGIYKHLTIAISTGGTTSVGVYISRASAQTTLVNAFIDVDISSGTGRGVYSNASGGTTNILHSIIDGDSSTSVYRSDGFVLVNSTNLLTPTSGTVSCGGVFDASFTFYANTCP